MRLSQASLEALPADIGHFGYDRAEQAIGIVHFGIGAFHRAHQAWYTDRAMRNGDADWGILGVSLRSAGVADQLNPQDGLYTLAECSAEGERTQVIGAVQRVLVAGRETEAIVAALAAPTTQICTFTITERGYCRAVDGSLDRALAHGGSIYALLAQGLERRRLKGLGGLTLLSCDNLAHNGRQLEQLMAEYLSGRDSELARWVRAECTFPSSMVDRIVPATTPADLASIAERLGMKDHGAVMTEPFSQWVVEDCFAGPRPSWDKVGADFVSDVAPYETAKLRMLNGAHSALAYLGLRQGHVYVHEAVVDTEIRPTVEQLMRLEAAGSLEPAPGQDLAGYADLLMGRFANPALQHRLSQIAMDGSQKVPQRWLDTLAFHQREGRSCPAILKALAAWLRHVRGDNGPVDDPLAERMAQAWSHAGTGSIIEAMFGSSGLIASPWHPSPDDRDLIVSHLEREKV